MMRSKPVHQTDSQAGAVVLFVAVLMVVLLGMAAFAIDLAYIASVKTQVQNAADSSALAAASELYDFNGILDPLTKKVQPAAQISLSRTEARTFSGLNRGGGVDLTDVPDQDITFGYLSPANPDEVRNYSIQMHSPPSGDPNNSVRVTVRRDDQANTRLKVFFARVLGSNGADVSASATATYVKAELSYNTRKFIPLSIKKHNNSSQVPDHVFWDSTSRQSNSYTFNRDTQQLSSGPDGMTEYTLRTAIDNDTEPNHFGLAYIGASANATRENINRQILQGPSAADYATLPHGKLDMEGCSGLTLTGFTQQEVLPSLAAFRALVGQPRIALVYDSVDDGNSGMNATFQLVGATSVVICEVAQEGPFMAGGELKYRLRMVVQPEIVHTEGGERYAGDKTYSLKLTR